MRKKIIFVFLLIVSFGLGVGADTIFNAEQVLYKDDKTVKDAINDLYEKVNFGDATASDILSGKKALVGGKEVTGSLTCPTCPSYTSLSGTKSVGAGSSTTFNGYYNMSNYKVQCGTNSCASCNSCCSSNARYGTISCSSGSTYTISTGLGSISKFVVYWVGNNVSRTAADIYDVGTVGSSYHINVDSAANPNYSGKQSIGSRFSTSFFSINWVSGGQVSITTPSISAFSNTGTCVWFAY